MYKRQAQLKLSGRGPVTRELARDAEKMVFDVELEEGPLDVEALVIQRGGKTTGAYYVYAWKI